MVLGGIQHNNGKGLILIHRGWSIRIRNYQITTNLEHPSNHGVLRANQTGLHVTFIFHASCVYHHANTES